MNENLFISLNNFLAKHKNFWYNIYMRSKGETMNDNYKPKFSEFLHNIETTEFETNTTATGALTIQQSTRNELRKEGLAALKADLE